MGPFQLDRSTKIILPDGRWCFFKELKPYTGEEQGNQDQQKDGEKSGGEDVDATAAEQ
jgi:hypothetical protein